MQLPLSQINLLYFFLLLAHRSLGRPVAVVVLFRQSLGRFAYPFRLLRVSLPVRPYFPTLSLPFVAIDPSALCLPASLPASQYG